MKNFSRSILLLCGVGLLAVIAALVLFEKVPPGTIGVKQAQWGGGIIAQDYTTGFHLGITGYHKWHFLDKKTHFLTFSQNANPGSPQERPALSIRTLDNNSAEVDVSLTYRIIPGEGHLVVSDGEQSQYRENVASTVRSVLREQLAKLSSEDFVSTEARLARTMETIPLIDSAIKEFHAECNELLIRAVRFPPDYESKLQEKQLSRQSALLFQAKEKVEKQQQVTGVISKETEAMEKEKRADWDRRLQDIRSDNEIAVATVLGEAEIYALTTRANAEATYVTALAEGELALAKAEALRDELRNKALDTVGGSILLATQAANNLDIAEVTLNSNDPAVPSVLDLSEMVRLLIGE